MQITKHNWPIDTVPLVSISCITYSHENYIRDAIDGFLMQDTDFKVEILIHDDASPDKTADIIKHYEKKHPQLIFPIYQKNNQKSQGKKPGMNNYNRARGKYIALCEGDDYWTDPYKLQKQVDFLEMNEDYGLVHGDCNIFYEEKGKWKFHANKDLLNNCRVENKNKLFTFLIEGSYKIRTATVLFRKDLLSKRKTDTVTFLMGDTPMWLDFSQMTKFKYFDEVWAVYRILPDSRSRSKDQKCQRRFNLSMAEMRVYYSKKHNFPISKKLSRRYNNQLIAYKIFDKDKEYKELYPLINNLKIERFKFNAISFELIRRLIVIFLRLKKTIKSAL